MRWLVLLVILWGTFASSVGGTNSHGIAALADEIHADPGLSVAAPGHAHADEDGAWAAHGATADHPHHAADHSHDKAHALPAAWRANAPLLPLWFGHTPVWIESVEPSRLERPPMG
jgi:hypothetical protein